MANCCFGSLTIDCDKALFEEIRSFVQSEEKVFDLNRIVPIPADREYDWVIDHWGTGKNVDDECLSGQSYCFTTAWSPCSPAVQALAERYPQATFRYTYDECGEGFCGVEEYRDGSLAYRLDADYHEFFADDEPQDEPFIDKNILPYTGKAIDQAVFMTEYDGEWAIGEIYYREQVDESWGRECKGTVQYIGEPPKVWY